MTGRVSHAMTLALRDVGRGLSLSEAARRHGVHVRALRRACRREGMAPRAGGRPRQGGAA